LKDSAEKGLLELYSDTVHDETGDYTQDWKVKGANINELAKAWNTSKENIMTILTAAEDTRSWNQFDWSELFGGTEDIGTSAEAMQGYLDDLKLLQKYNPDMDMTQYLRTAGAGLKSLKESNPDLNIQEYIDQINEIARLTG